MHYQYLPTCQRVAWLCLTHTMHELLLLPCSYPLRVDKAEYDTQDDDVVIEDYRDMLLR